jgi:hypothetical protein
MGCTSIQGTAGLAPLKFSHRLEQIELRKRQQEIETCGETGFNDAFVVAVLSSMAPINESLSRQGSSSGRKIVKIRKQNDCPTFFESFAEPISGFLFVLMEAISNQVKEQHVVCKDCNFVLVDRIPKQDFAWKGATCFCAKCKAHFCGEKVCELVLECDVCMDQCCGNCMFVNCCNQCTKCFCDHCRLMGCCESEQCGGKYYCVEYQETTVCETCDPMKSWCTQCRSVTTCNSCGQAVCAECGTAKSCEQCECAFCAECNSMEYCSHCKKSHCTDCRSVECRRQGKRAADKSAVEESCKPPAKRSRAK